jgi:hypothetical protein
MHGSRSWNLTIHQRGGAEAPYSNHGIDMDIGKQ